MLWNDLRQHTEVSDEIWNNMCQYFCTDSEFKTSFYHYGGGSKIKRRIVLLHYINIILHSNYIPKILWQDRDFILLYLKHNEYGYSHVDVKWISDPEIILEMIKHRGPHILERASESLKNNRKFMMLAIKYDSGCLEYAHSDLSNDIELVNEAVCQNGYALKYASDELKNNKDIVRIAIRKNGAALAYASAELKSNRDLVLEAVKGDRRAFVFADVYHDDTEILMEAFRKHPISLDDIINIRNGVPFEYASPRLKADRNVVLELVKYCGMILGYTNFTADAEIVLAAVKQNGMALQHTTSNVLRQDREIVAAAVRQNGCALKYAADVLKSDEGIVMLAVRQNGEALEYTAPICRANRKISLAAVKQTGKAYRFTTLSSDPELLLIAFRPHLQAHTLPGPSRDILTEKFYMGIFGVDTTSISLAHGYRIWIFTFCCAGTSSR